MQEFDLNGPRCMAVTVAAHVACLEERIAFAEAVLPLMTRYRDAGAAVGYVTSVLPKGLPSAQWLALAEDHLAFLVPVASPAAED